jgi:hypothetical protein
LPFGCTTTQSGNNAIRFKLAFNVLMCRRWSEKKEFTSFRISPTICCR